LGGSTHSYRQRVIPIPVGKASGYSEGLPNFLELILHHLTGEDKGLISDVVIIEELQQPLNDRSNACHYRSYPSSNACRRQNARSRSKSGCDSCLNLSAVSLIMLPQRDERANLSFGKILCSAVLTPDAALIGSEVSGVARIDVAK